jgi:hypothetical protein
MEQGGIYFRLVLDHDDDTGLGLRGLAMADTGLMHERASWRRDRINMVHDSSVMLAKPIGDTCLDHQLFALRSYDNWVLESIKFDIVIHKL